MCKKSYWIWNYGDYEIFHSNLANSRRQEYGADYPVFWRLYDVEHNVKFFCDFTAPTECEAELFVNGMGYILVDDERFAANKAFKIKKGAHRLQISVTNLKGLPAAYLKSDACVTDGSWFTRDGQLKEVPVGYEVCYNTPDKNPEIFHFEYKTLMPVLCQNVNGGKLFDFGKEIFGYLNVENALKSEGLHISYGESEEEALDVEFSILFEDVSGETSYKLRQRAFRYIFITGGENVTVSADYEYLPLEYKGSFECDDENVNGIWNMCAYTLHLTSREVQLEAIKRDRWLWGGDAYQAYKFNNYLFFDKEIIRRSTTALRGKDPVVEHINTITDYSFYWVIGLEEYYLNYKDTDFVRFIYPRAVSLMEFSSKRTNADGFITGKDTDWIFIDWSDIDKCGAVCAEQMLYIAANKAMARLADVVGEDGQMYADIAANLTQRVNEHFWNDEKGAFIDSYESGKNNVTRHANIFALMYDIATPSQVKSITERVLLNDEITQITTPYFEGYELDVFGMLGNFDYIENKIKTYWQGMVDLGATTVWEEYNPNLSGTEHYGMYGGKYAKSLCHAWGAAPIYLFGKYFLGVSPTSPGFETFTVKPYRGGFEYIKGTVPIKDGEVKVYLSSKRLSVIATKDGGTLFWDNKEYKLNAGEELLLKF